MHEFNDISDQLVDKLRGFAVDETRVDIAEHLHHAALDIIGKVLFSQSISWNDNYITERSVR